MRSTNSQDRLLRRLKIALVATFLLQFLNGCATTGPVVTKTVREKVPATLTSPCGLTVLQGKTVADAVKLAKARELDVQECNKRLEDIRKWSDSGSSPN